MKDLLPIMVCVVLPVAIVAIVFGARIFSENRRAQVLMKAIETNPDIDFEKLAVSLGTPRKTPCQMQSGRLLRGCAFSLVGLTLSLWGVLSSAPLTEEMGECYFLPGGISLSIGISYLIVFYINRKKEI